MARRKMRRKKRNKGFGLFSMMLVLLLIAGGYFYFFRNPGDSNDNSDASVASIANTVPTPSATVTSTPVNTAESSPNTESVVTAAQNLTTDTPQKTEDVQETPIVIQQKGASIQVINYTGQKNLAEEIRATLEEYGFIVSSGNGSSLKYISTAIVEKKEDVSGEELGNLLNIKKIRKEIDHGSRFDFIVILGDDFNP